MCNYYFKDLGIMPHSDGPLYYPVTYVLSLLSHSTLVFYDSIDDYYKSKPYKSFFI